MEENDSSSLGGRVLARLQVAKSDSGEIVQRGCSVDEVGVFFNHTEGIHRSDSGFTNVAESDKLNLMSLSWRRIQPGCQSLVSACRAKNFALAAVKAALFLFPTHHLITTDRPHLTTPARYNCLAVLARSIFTSPSPAHSTRQRSIPTHIHIKDRHGRTREHHCHHARPGRGRCR